MEQLVTNLVINFPNFAGLLLMLAWQRQTINSLLDNQSRLIDYLLAEVDHEKAQKKPPMQNMDGDL